MGKSNWFKNWGAAAGLFVTIIGSTAVLSFKIGVVNEKVNAMEKPLGKAVDDIQLLKNDVTEIRVDIAEIKAKLDVLWSKHLSEPQTNVAGPPKK